ncbi:hypothetical protein ACW9IB_11060 [Pseudomonas sp. SDO524_S393]
MILLDPGHSRRPVYKVLGLVLIVPLMISLMKLGTTGVIVALASSVYGVWFAAHHASKGLTVMAAIISGLNLVSTVMFSTSSVLIALGHIAWLYAYPPLSEWRYWL